MAEEVRQETLRALDDGTEFTGSSDADLAIPSEGESGRRPRPVHARIRGEPGRPAATLITAGTAARRPSRRSGWDRG
jgi:hypothetical protein